MMNFSVSSAPFDLSSFQRHLGVQDNSDNSKVRIVLLGSRRGCGKSYLINTLLETTAPTESEYNNNINNNKNNVNYNFSSNPSNYYSNNNNNNNNTSIASTNSYQSLT